MTVDNLRGHTCKFNIDEREHSMAQILRPTNMAMHYSQVSKARNDLNKGIEPREGRGAACLIKNVL